MKRLFAAVFALVSLFSTVHAEDKLWVTYPGGEGPGKGKHIVLLAGDEEYRSEEALPQLGKILSVRHGFKCTVIFPIDPATGTIDPDNQTNLPGMQALESADLVVCSFRFRNPPDKDMKYFVDYLEAGKPIIAIRTATHAFNIRSKTYAKYDWQSKEWPGGFGQQVLGDTWVSHHGVHNGESARGLINGPVEKHPVLKSVKDVWGPTDVYGIVRLKPEDTILLYGLVLKGMKADSPPNNDKSIMPLVWMREYQWPNGKVTKSMTSTIGAAVDLLSEDLRRLFVNASYHLTGLEVPQKADVTLVGEFQPTYFGFKGGKKGVRPAEHELK